ncbi:MAG: DUF4163 domain-containing protein [Pseudomonadota bacterium]
MRHGSFFAIALIGAATAAAAAPVKIERTSNLLDFTFAWPANAAAVPALDHRFRSELAKAFKQSLTNAREDKALAKTQQRPFNQHFYSMQWSSAGETPRLLSLQSQLSAFEGGAHPNTNYGALLWDRRSKQETSLGALFLRSSSFAALMRTPYCEALDKERTKRRGGFKIDLPEFNVCPKLSELAVAPADRDRDGRFDSIDFVASPYTAGPYAEGEYDIRLPVTRQLIAAVKPAYRASFEAQRQ